MARRKFVRIPRRAWVLGTSTLVIAGLVAALAFLWSARHDAVRFVQRASLPEAVEYEEAGAGALLPTAGIAPTATPAVASRITPAPTVASGLPAEVNLAVPFTPQAPHANWDLPYKEFCEEASVLMVSSYLKGEAIPNADFADTRMQEIRAFEEARFGYYEDTDAAETAVILREHYNISNVRLLENPTANDMREALAAGKLVIMPAAGRLLGNPYFQTPGPLYHMIVLKGYTKNGDFIANDPGTRRGADFIYSEATLMNAMHDWRQDAKVELGRKVVIIVG